MFSQQFQNDLATSKLLIHPKWYERCLRFSGLLPSPETLITKNTVPSPFSRNPDIPGATSCSPEDDVTSYLYDFSILACWQQHQMLALNNYPVAVYI